MASKMEKLFVLKILRPAGNQYSTNVGIDTSAFRTLVSNLINKVHPLPSPSPQLRPRRNYRVYIYYSHTWANECEQI